jgi:hypothetical protein
VTLDLTSEREEIKGKVGFKGKDLTIEKIEKKFNGENPFSKLIYVAIY